jgi:proline iminopeptidase
MYRPIFELLQFVTSQRITTSLLLVILALISIRCSEELEINKPGNLVPLTVDQDPSLPSIRVNGAQLHAEAFGNPNDPMVVILHGGPGLDYRHLLNLKALANEGYYVVFFDQRGAGLSERVAYSSYSMQLAFDDLRGVIAHYRTSPAQKVFLLGHSWGAMLATAYINVYPTAADGLILAEPGGLKWGDVEDYMARAQDYRLFSEELNDAVFSEQFLTGKITDHAILDYKFSLWASTESAEDSPMGNEGTLPKWRDGAVNNKAYIDIATKERPDWTTNLSAYTTPILFIYSENNRAYGLAHAEKVSSAYPNVQLIEAVDAGHDMFSFAKGFNNTLPAMITYLNSLK